MTNNEFMSLSGAPKVASQTSLPRVDGLGIEEVPTVSSGSELLGIERSRLLGRPFGLLASELSRPAPRSF